ncbi:uncharacterized protein LOC110031271, partial [Phalaenopsis equestris]|uniref:uncharacterized protein LOC110031271 n=1 Tax=Phalaenopsis equestris TaxID=78828 RepID=UPI0009E5462E
HPPVEIAAGRYPPCRSVGRIVSLRCLSALLFGVAVLLSAVFWLPTYFRRGSGRGGLDLDEYEAPVLASFRLQKPVALLNLNVAKLQYDIFAEIGVPNTTVSVFNMEPFGINSTNIVFGMWPYPKKSNISTGLSILKSSFVSLVLRQSTLHLTTPLFGSSYFFQILKFPGGITIVPLQNAFLLQKEHMIFNFSLNFPIYQVEDKIDELKDQMKLGLRLTSYEILFVRLTNINGSTVSPPTVVETSIVFAVGNNLPSMPRLMQLAQNIRNSSAGNLGLNHTIFGRVKQIRLSSFLQRSLNSSFGFSSSPSPSPQPSGDQHHDHHSHNSHHSDVHDTLSPSPSPEAKPVFSQAAPPRPGCRFRFSRDPKGEHQIVPTGAPASAPYLSASPSSEDSSAPAPHLPPKQHKSSVIFADSRPPGEAARDVGRQNTAPSISPLRSSSFVSGHRRTHLILASLVFLWL